jgi:hypothetical protein
MESVNPRWSQLILFGLISQSMGTTCLEHFFVDAPHMNECMNVIVIPGKVNLKIQKPPGYTVKVTSTAVELLLILTDVRHSVQNLIRHARRVDMSSWVLVIRIVSSAKVMSFRWSTLKINPSILGHSDFSLAWNCTINQPNSRGLKGHLCLTTETVTTKPSPMT